VGRKTTTQSISQFDKTKATLSVIDKMLCWYITELQPISWDVHEAAVEITAVHDPLAVKYGKWFQQIQNAQLLNDYIHAICRMWFITYVFTKQAFRRILEPSTVVCII